MMKLKGLRPRTAKFRYETSEAAMEHNRRLLGVHMENYPKWGGEGDIVNPDTEFNAIEDIKRVLGRHPAWAGLASIIQDGVSYTTTQLDEEK